MNIDFALRSPSARALALLATMLLACSPSPSAPDAGGADTGTGGADTGTGGADTGTGGADTGTGGGDAGVSDVAACEAAVDAVRAACVAEDPTHSRLCYYDALRPLCATGRTAFVRSVFECLTADACQTPSDPSDAGACVQALIASTATATDRAFGATICGCSASPEPGCDMDLPAFTLGSAMMMREADVMAADACMTAMGCSMSGACVMASPLAPALTCP